MCPNVELKVSSGPAKRLKIIDFSELGSFTTTSKEETVKRQKLQELFDLFRKRFYCFKYRSKADSIPRHWFSMVALMIPDSVSIMHPPAEMSSRSLIESDSICSSFSLSLDFSASKSSLSSLLT